mgnify:FL=1
MGKAIQHNIKCSVFLETEAVIKNIISKFYKAGLKERQDYTQDILVETNTLLLCSNYSSKNPDCSNCHSVSRKYLQDYGYLSKAE